MVFVKVREVYDLQTVQNKMTVIGIRTPKPQIIKDNFPGLLMQCKMWRPYSCDVRMACASVQALDALQVGTADGDVSPEDVFNPILYKATSNLGMSQIEGRIQKLVQSPTTGGGDVDGPSAMVDVNSTTNLADEFPVYYGLLANAHGWKHANPQAGLSMSGLKPLVYEALYNIGQNGASPATYDAGQCKVMYDNGDAGFQQAYAFRGNPKPMPFINTTDYAGTGYATGFSDSPTNNSGDVPDIRVMCGCIIIPPMRLHSLFFRMVVEWTLEFTSIRPIGEVTNWTGLATLASHTHYQNYDYSAAKSIAGIEESVLDTSDQNMVDANVDIKKVM